MTRSRLRIGWVVGMAMLVGVSRGLVAAEPIYQQDFSQLPVGRLPDEFLVLDGQFGVKEEGGQKFLELPGAPLETFGVLFGTSGKEDWGAQARIFGTGQGRRFPVFGVSVNGVGGFRLQVAPAKKALELLKGDEVQTSVPYAWESGTWTQLRIQIRKTGDATWKVEGKAWKDGAPEPGAWMIAWDEKEGLVAGRAAVWGKPFSETPIRFDDLKVQPAQK